MKAKKRKNRKKKSGSNSLLLMRRLAAGLYRSRMVRTGIAILVVLLLLRGAYALIDRAFTVMEVEVIGNRYVSDSEVVRLMKVRKGTGLLSLDGEKALERLSLSPWLKEVRLRKELPHRLVVWVKEDEPVAILKRKGRLFLINSEGTPLESLKETVSFLPVISLRSNVKGTLKEAIRLARVIRERHFFENRDVRIIAASPEEITLMVDKLPIKIGKGRYEQKLSRLVALEERVLRREIPVQYIDLRFAKRVIVMPEKGK